MIVKVKHHCSDFNSYRAARVKSLFNAENGCDWERSAELPVEGLDWKIGLIVGPSGSGKTSIGSRIFGEPIYDLYAGWDATKPIVDCIAPDGDFNAVTGALSAVGLGDVPAWLRPFPVLSNGEKFRAGLARLVCERPKRAVVDEFTSVIDRQIAKVGAAAFAKTWQKVMGRLSCFPATTILSNGCSRIGYMICRRPGFTIGTAFNAAPSSNFKFIKSGELCSPDCLSSIII